MPQFDDQSARRISDTVRGWERRVRNGPQKRARWHGGSKFRIFTCELTQDLDSGSSAAATLLTGASKTTSGESITVKDVPAFITAGYMLQSGTKLRVFRDPDVSDDANVYCLLTSSACEVAQGSGS